MNTLTLEYVHTNSGRVTSFGVNYSSPDVSIVVAVYAGLVKVSEGLPIEFADSGTRSGSVKFYFRQPHTLAPGFHDCLLSAMTDDWMCGQVQVRDGIASAMHADTLLTGPLTIHQTDAFMWAKQNWKLPWTAQHGSALGNTESVT